MRHFSPFLAVAASALAASLCADGQAQCTTYDFSEYSVGTVITTQYDGVTFSAPPGSCGGGFPKPVIVAPAQGTSSGANALGLQTGCPDFSPDRLLMEFDDLQSVVTFYLGEQAASGQTFTVRSYSASGGLIQFKNMVTGSGVFRFVQMGSESGPANIKKIEIEEWVGLFETIDDLSFNHDATPPTAEIHTPTHSDCLCGPNVYVTGIACDFDGDYGMDKLEYRLVNADPGDPWVLIGDYTSPVCEPGSLYTWDVSGIAHGWYFLRLTVENACGMASTDIVSVYVDKAFGTVDIDYPPDGGVVCGKIDIEGTVNDSCGHCLNQYVVKYRHIDGGAWLDVDPSHPAYPDIVINGDLAVWDTVALGLPDGIYYLVVEGEDECGNTEDVQIKVVLDNASGCGCVGDLDGNEVVDVLDLLALLGSWGPCP